MAVPPNWYRNNGNCLMRLSAKEVRDARAGITDTMGIAAITVMTGDTRALSPEHPNISEGLYISLWRGKFPYKSSSSISAASSLYWH
jgi:hypothetical protein